MCYNIVEGISADRAGGLLIFYALYIGRLELFYYFL